MPQPTQRRVLGFAAASLLWLPAWIVYAVCRDSAATLASGTLANERARLHDG